MPQMDRKPKLRERQPTTASGLNPITIFGNQEVLAGKEAVIPVNDNPCAI